MSKSGNKALIVDYEPRGIKQLSDPLEAEGFEILLAKDGVAGLETFKNERPDIVLIEAMLPKRHGFEVCQEIKGTDEGGDVPVIIVSSVYKGRKYRSQALHQHHADEFLEKPVPADKLMEVIDRLLDGRAPRKAAAPAVEATPEPAPAAAPAPAAGGDSAEAEIVDRLNSILGEPSSSGS
jgi:DNA-binding response OmpR family regulator